MKAEEIAAGDQFIDEHTGRVAYTVAEPPEPAHDGRTMVARVVYHDGGDGYRQWDVGQETRLVRPIR